MFKRLFSGQFHVPKIVVMDRASSFNAWGGPLATEIRGAMQGITGSPIYNFIYGLGGRDISVNNLSDIFTGVSEDKFDKEVNYYGVRK